MQCSMWTMLGFVAPLILLSLYLLGDRFHLGHERGRPAEGSSKIKTNTVLPVGLENLSNTCYMNSILQSLYASKSYRNAIVKSSFVPHSVGIDLKSLFGKLQRREAGEPFTLSIARTLDIDIRVQQDAEEFLLTLLNRVDDSLSKKGAEVPSRAMQVRTVQHIQCLHVPYNRTKIQRGFDIAVDIEGHSSLVDALRSHFQPENLTADGSSKGGGNQVRAGEFGLQDAVKSHLLQKYCTDAQECGTDRRDDALPEHLVLQLKRFSYDAGTGTMEKVGHPVAVPLTLDLSAFCHPGSHHQGQYQAVDSQEGNRADGIAAGLASAAAEGSLSSEQDGGTGARGTPSRSDEYELTAVVVHAGRLDAGHYYCLARHEVGDAGTDTGTGNADQRARWVRINDHAVREVSVEDVLQEARGAQAAHGSVSSNAYLLFYTRRR